MKSRFGFNRTVAAVMTAVMIAGTVPAGAFAEEINTVEEVGERSTENRKHQGCCEVTG